MSSTLLCCLLFFMYFARFQILRREPQSIWRKLLLLSWLYFRLFFVAIMLKFCHCVASLVCDCLADTFRYEQKSSTRQLLLQDKVRNDTVSYKVKRHCLLQDIFSKKTLSVPTFSVETLLVVRHFQLLIKKTLSVMRHLQ